MHKRPVFLSGLVEDSVDDNLLSFLCRVNSTTSTVAVSHWLMESKELRMLCLPEKSAWLLVTETSEKAVHRRWGHSGRVWSSQKLIRSLPFKLPWKVIHLGNNYVRWFVVENLILRSWPCFMLYRACVFCNSSRCVLIRLPGDDFGGGFEGGEDFCHYNWMQGHYPRRAPGQDVGRQHRLQHRSFWLRDWREMAQRQLSV